MGTTARSNGSNRTGAFLARDTEAAVEDLYRRVQLPDSWVKRLTEELEAEIVDRQAEASEGRVILTKKLARLATSGRKLLHAFYANAIPLELLKSKQDRMSREEEVARSELDVTEQDLSGREDVLGMAIQLAGNCHAAYLKARPSVRRRFNEAVVEAVYVKDRKIVRADSPRVRTSLLSPELNRRLKVDLRGRYPNRLRELRMLVQSCLRCQ